MRQIIEVTQTDIDEANATRKAYLEKHGYATAGILPGRCPIALALLRTLQAEGQPINEATAHPDFLLVFERVYEGTCSMRLNQRYGHATGAMKRFMKRWDRTWKASPTRFLVIWD